jgi:hypothetical protein
MPAPAILAGIGKALGGSKILSGIGKLVGGLFKKKAGGTAVGKVIKGASGLLRKKPGGTLAGNLLRGIGGVPGALSLGSTALSGIQGKKQQQEAERALAALKDPGFAIPEEYQTNLAQAEQMARQGLPAEQYNLATTNIQRGTQAGLRQLGRMANPFAGIAGLARVQSDALAGLDASNAAARRQNILGAMGARSQLAQAKLAQQQYAQQRYFEQVNQANALKGAGMQNVAGALGNVANIGMMLGMYGGGNAPSKASPSPMSPAQMNVISNYKTPSLNTAPMTFQDFQRNKNLGGINLGSLNTGSRFSGFGFRK